MKYLDLDCLINLHMISFGDIELLTWHHLINFQLSPLGWNYRRGCVCPSTIVFCLQYPHMFRYLVLDEILFWNLLEVLQRCFYTTLNDSQFIVCQSVCLLDYFLTEICLIVISPVLDDLSSWDFWKHSWDVCYLVLN